MDYVAPHELIQAGLAAAEKRSLLSVRDLLIRSFLAGAILSYATSLAFVVTSQGLPPIVGAILFPVGFVMLVLLGLELATGNFAMLPAGMAAGRVSVKNLLRNWALVYGGNLAGSLFYALLFYLAVTNANTGSSGNLGELFKAAAQKKTLAYMTLGARGWETALIKGVLCNWMVTLGVVLALASRSTVGKVVAMWLPILTFFAQGFEHSIVNMFVIPAGMLFGAPVSIRQWWLWNQIPVTVGNIVSGALLTGLALYFTFKPRKKEEVVLLTESTLVHEPALNQVQASSSG
jgi:formate/nitrite transporter